MNQLPFRIKICGITNTADALAVHQAGADAIGLNFYPQSPRFVSPLDAAFICLHLPRTVQRVGVFVNDSAETIREITNQLQLDYVQLHGDESVEFVQSLNPIPIILARRVDAGQIHAWEEGLAQLPRACPNVRAILLDAKSESQFGGTGKTIDWKLLTDLNRPQLPYPVVLAGGLNPENVANAIEACNPSAVDTASGVEDSPRKKNVAKIDRFTQIARRAWQTRENREVS